MGKRREPRKPVQVKVRIFGTDAEGRIFSENVTTLDVSNNGIRLSGVRAKLKIDEIIGLTYGANKVHFRVKRIGDPATPAEGCVGLANLSPERPLWDFPLPQPIMDNFRAESLGDRRHSPRLKCSVSVELRAEGEPTTWGKASDLSLGGCFVEMPIPMNQGPRSTFCFGSPRTKLKLHACVASSAPGFGIGVRFLDVAPQDQELLSRFLRTTAKEG